MLQLQYKGFEMSLREIKDFKAKFDHMPRAFTTLFETDDLMGVRQRAADAGFRIVEPVIEEIPETVQGRPPRSSPNSSRITCLIGLEA